MKFLEREAIWIVTVSRKYGECRLKWANFIICMCNIVRVIDVGRMRWTGHVARMGERRGAYRGLVGKPKGKLPPGRSRRRWQDNIKINLQ